MRRFRTPKSARRSRPIDFAGRPLEAGQLIRALVSAAASILFLASCATVPSQADSLSRIANDYLLTQLIIGEKEPGYIDAYYGPPEVKAEAQAAAPSLDLAALRVRVADLRARIAAQTGSLSGMDLRRARYFDAHLNAAATRLRMLQGENLPFADEAEGLFGVRPQLRPLSEYDAVLARIEALLPGDGTLVERIDAFDKRQEIPADRVVPVIQASIAECRQRTLAHVAMPASERFDLALARDKPWGAYNFYQGAFHSKIEVNVDLPVKLSDALLYGCHEGHPGHHVQNLLTDGKMARAKGWVEFTVQPLFSPQALLNEGGGDYGLKLAFPGREAQLFQRDVLAPLAGIPFNDVKTAEALSEATDELSGARPTIASMLLAGQIDEAEFVRLSERYNLLTPERARQSLSFVKTYRSYVINYVLGEDLIAHDIAAAGPNVAARWARLEQIFSEPTLPADLR